MDRVLDVVGLLRIRGDQGVQRFVAPVGQIGGLAAGRIVHIVRREKTQKLANHGEAICIVSGDEVGHAAFFVVGHGAAELLLGDFLVGDGLNDVGAGDEHVGSLAGHENKIGDRGRIDGAARARAHNGADLRDHAAGESIAQKNIGVTGKRSDALLNTRAAGIVEADHGSAGAHGKVHDLADFARVGFGERAAENGEVLGKNVDETAIDLSKAGDEAVAGGALLLHAKIDATMTDKFVEFFKGAFVQQQMDAFARGELAGFVFAFAAFRAAPRFGFRGLAAELFHAVVMLILCACGGVFLRQTFLPEQRCHFWRRCARQDGWPAIWCPEARRRQATIPQRWLLRAGEWKGSK